MRGINIFECQELGCAVRLKKLHKDHVALMRKEKRDPFDGTWTHKCTQECAAQESAEHFEWHRLWRIEQARKGLG